MFEKFALIVITAATTGIVFAGSPSLKDVAAVTDANSALLEKNTDGKGFGPQSPRDLSS